MTLSEVFLCKDVSGLSERVRVAGGDLCRRWSAEAPTEPAGETGGVAPLSADNSPQNAIRFAVLPECCSCPGISPQRCLAHIIAKSYPIRTVIQLSKKDPPNR